MFCKESEHKVTIFFFFLNFDTVFENPSLENFANIFRIEQDGISLIKFETAHIHFISDIFVAFWILPKASKQGQHLFKGSIQFVTRKINIVARKQTIWSVIKLYVQDLFLLHCFDRRDKMLIIIYYFILLLFIIIYYYCLTTKCPQDFAF